MNWGNMILFTLIFFVTGMLGMVFIASKQENELVETNYYQKELKYQAVIDAKNNLKRISDHNIVSQVGENIKITFPAGTFEKLEEGNIQFIRPSDQTLDRSIQIIPNQTGFRTFPKSDFSKGMYKVKISWVNGGVDLFAEESMYIQ